MGRVGTWYHEVAEGYYTESAPVIGGEVTVSYADGKHRFEYDMVDDAGNHITGSAEGALVWSYEGE
jgi:hypothetical protein